MQTDSRDLDATGAGKQTKALAILLALGLGLGSPTATIALTDQENCIYRLNRSLGKVAKAAGKELYACMKRASSGILSETVEDCVANDLKNRIARAQARTVTAEQQYCSVDPPSYGINDAEAINAAAVLRTLGLARNLLGGDVTAGLVSMAEDRDTATCQLKVARSVVKCRDTRLKELGKCLRAGVPSAEAFVGCVEAAPTKKLTKDCDPATGSLSADKIQRSCTDQGVDLQVAFPACGTSDPAGVAGCIDRVGRCQGCSEVRTASSLGSAIDCDIFDDGVETPAQGSLSADLEALLESADPSELIPVVIPLSETADLSGLEDMAATKADRLPFVVKALKETAARTQNQASGCSGGGLGLLQELEAAGSERATDIRSLWLTNSVAVETTPEVILSCAARADIGQIEFADVLADADEGSAAQTAQAPTCSPVATEPNLELIRADEVWSLGVDGSLDDVDEDQVPAVIVGLVGTGVDASHPDLSGNLLRRPDGSAVWKDLLGATTNPHDPDGQGTHLAGVAVGANGIGVAPQARWSACRAEGSGGGTIRDVLECVQFLMDPDGLKPAEIDLTNAEERKRLAKHSADVVLVPSWLPTLRCDDQWVELIRRLREARTLPVFAVGHDLFGGPGTLGVPSPANHPEAFSVGASDPQNPYEILATSYRGDADCSEPDEPTRPAPRLIAPGVDVCSAWPGGGHAAPAGNPEAVAAAHAAGAAALVLSAQPALTVDQLDRALERTAASDPTDPTKPALLLDAYAAVTLEEATLVDLTGLGIACAPDFETCTATGAVQANTPQPVSITFRNDGVTTWSQGTHILTPVYNNWGVSGVSMSEGSVLPGSLATFSFPGGLTVPFPDNLAPGYEFQWQIMNSGVPLDDATPLVQVSVFGVPAAAFLQSQIPSPLEPNDVVQVAFTFRNTGTTVWDSSYGLKQVPPGPGLQFSASPQPIPSGTTVPPCPSTPTAECDHTFSFSVATPPIQGTYSFLWQVVKAFGTADEASFGEPSNPIPPVDGSDDAEAIGDFSGPSFVSPGEAVDIVQDLENTGTNVWLEDEYCLRPLETQWAGAEDCVNANYVPGDQPRFTLRLTAPSSGPERYRATSQMYNDSGEPFGPTFEATVGVTGNHQASEGFSSIQGANYWSYRYFGATVNMWKDMTTWVEANQRWEQGDGEIHGDWMLPRDQGAVARIWQSPVNGTIEISGQLSKPETGGDGVRFKIKHNKDQVLFNEIVNSGTLDYGPIEVDVVVDDTIRFVLKPRGDNNYDNTLVDPLIRVLPPGEVGAVVAQQVSHDPELEGNEGDPD